MNYTPRQMLSTWYRYAELNPTAEQLQKRTKAIEKITEKTESKYWLQLVRFYLGYPITDSKIKDEFLLAFKNEDDAFPLTEKNDNLIDTLVKCALIFKLHSGSSFENDIIALSILSGSVLLRKAPNSDIPVYDCAKTYLYTESHKERKVEYDGSEDVEDLKKRLSDMEESEQEDWYPTKSDVEAIVEDVESISNQVKSLLEESNLLWWLFGQYSFEESKTFKEIGLGGMLGIIPMKFLSQTKFATPFVSSFALARKALLISAGEKETSLKATQFNTLISSIPKDLVSKIVDLASENGNLKCDDVFVPCLGALKKTLEIADGADWTVLRPDRTINYSMKVEPVKIAVGIYFEMLLAKKF